MACVHAGGEEGTLLFTEDSPVLDLALDTTGSCNSLWVATTATSVNKWPVDPNKGNSFYMNGASSGEEEEDLGITDVDEPTPLFFKPIATIPGKPKHSSSSLP